MSGPRALIVGAGVAGLSAAWWLARIGWQPLIIERAPDLRGGGYMMGLSGPGHQTAERMGLLLKLRALSYEINENIYRDRRGRELLRLRYRDFLQNLPYLAVRRDDLITAIDEAVGDKADRRFATTVTWIDSSEPKPRVRLSDGTEQQVDLVIGAVGFRSAIRPMRFGSDGGHLEPLGYRFAVFDIDDQLNLEADFLSYAEPGHLAEYYALRGGRLAAMHVWRDVDSSFVPAEDRWLLLDRVAQGSHPQVRAFLEAGRNGPPPLIDSLTLVNLPKWSNGRVVLLGDAAHCLTLVSGQGAGMAMASAEILSQELARSDIAGALAAYERRFRPAITRLQQRSRRMASIFIPESVFAFHLRNFTMRHMPRAWLGRYFANAIQSEIALVGTQP